MNKDHLSFSKSAQLLGQLAKQSLLEEVNLYPKPGLVTRISCGAHQDMDATTFEKSANALLPYMQHFAEIGLTFKTQDLPQLLVQIRPIGIEAEQAMFAATNNINTHKGAIFILGIFCAAAGFLRQTTTAITVTQLQQTIQQMCRGISQELSAIKQPIEQQTNGEKAFTQHGVLGVRGEAEAGFPTIMYGLQAYQRTVQKSAHNHHWALQTALLACMVRNNDSCLIKRGGTAGLAYAQDQAQQLIAKNLSTDELYQELEILDQQFIQRNLSPGGSADCLSAIYFIHQLLSTD